MKQIQSGAAAPRSIDGFCDPRFARVRETFEGNFAARGELGAAIAVFVDGRPVVDLWGGVMDRATNEPWQHNTLCLVFSATKGATALCAHVLAARGLLDLDAPVARYWPEFAQAGKESLPVSMLLNHQSGLAALARLFPGERVTDAQGLAAALAAQEPAWAPGTAHGYHALTLGWLIGELVRRVSGRSLGRFFREEVAGPLGLEFWIGLPPELEPRVARIRMAPPQPHTAAVAQAMRVPASLTARAFANPPGLLRASQVNSAVIHRAEIPAANGICTARALAAMYSELACGGARLVDRAALRRMQRTESRGHDLVLLVPTHFSSGFMKTADNRPGGDSAILGPNPGAFGHAGAGGSIGMADPEARVAIAYVMNQLGPGVMLNPRGQLLIDAVYEGLQGT